jgi:hypothetical protein
MYENTMIILICLNFILAIVNRNWHSVFGWLVAGITILQMSGIIN